MFNSSSEEDKEITERIIRIEQQLREINKDFKQVPYNTIDKNHKLSEPIMQRQSQITRFETDLAETDKTINYALANILPTINKKKGKERSKNDKSKGNKS